MLITALPRFRSDIQKCAEEAARQAYLTSQDPGAADPIIQKKLKADQEKAADNFAKKFAEILAPDLADAIYEFVKQIGITLTPSGSLISTSITSPAPVTGVSGPADFSIT